MEYTYPEREKGVVENAYGRVGRLWEVNRADIYSALAQVEKEDRLSFPRLLEKLRKEMWSVMRGSRKEREKWEQNFNKCYAWHYTVSVCQARCMSTHYYGETREIYNGRLKDYWYSVLGYGARPVETYQERESEVERMVFFE